MSITYYVDEAGDSALWARRGRLIVGTEGCSRFFSLGLAQVSEPQALETALESLRNELLNDPYFRNVPSMQKNKKKTALFFHAKDDLPEVRREVFHLILQHSVSFHSVIRDKLEVAKQVEAFLTISPTYRYNQNQLYDYMARSLLKDKLHSGDSCNVTFARRGKTDRTAALGNALETARDKWCRTHGVGRKKPPMTVRAAYPHQDGGLQVVDYFLWALQRLYEKGEDRYIELLWPKIHCVWDIDDMRGGSDGAYYTKEKPLNAASLCR